MREALLSLYLWLITEGGSSAIPTHSCSHLTAESEDLGPLPLLPRTLWLRKDYESTPGSKACSMGSSLPSLWALCQKLCGLQLLLHIAKPHLKCALD